MKKILSFFLFVLLVCPALIAEDYPKARIARKLSDYIDILRFKEDEMPIFVHKDDGKKLTYGQFEGDDGQDANAWSLFDILYEDVPVSYETGLNLMAKGEWGSALKMLKKSMDEKTPDKKPFRGTVTYKNYLEDKLLTCYLALGNKDAAKKSFEKIKANRKTHSWVMNMIKYVSFLVEAGEGSKALTLVDELLKLPLSKKIKMNMDLDKCLALSLSKKYTEAKRLLKDTVLNYEADFSSVKDKALEIESTILIYHEKNYRAGIKFFEKILKEAREQATADTYLKLGDCYFQEKKWELSRWNYIQAYILENDNVERIKLIIEKVGQANEKIPSKEGNKAIDAFFDKVSSSL
ncbi:MAG: hypothetical protein HQL32_01990 [Planctomycetes bacterium]|nr:hypothetical protein [Planctomycetota bacterium]